MKPATILTLRDAFTIAPAYEERQNGLSAAAGVAVGSLELSDGQLRGNGFAAGEELRGSAQHLYSLRQRKLLPLRWSECLCCAVFLDEDTVDRGHVEDDLSFGGLT